MSSVPSLPEGPGPTPEPENPEPENEVKLSFFAHLGELRKRMVQALLGVLVGMLVFGLFTAQVFDWLMVPVRAALPPGLKLSSSIPSSRSWST
jgi:Sec-independent protein secretion pathway component TatC